MCGYQPTLCRTNTLMQNQNILILLGELHGDGFAIFLLNQIKSNQILFIWHLSYFNSNTKFLTEAKNNNDIQHTTPPTPINTQRDTEIKQTHTLTQTHKLRPTAPIRQRHGRAPRPKARKERAPGPRPQGAPPQRQSRPGQTRGPTPRCRVLQPPGPEQSTGQHPPQWKIDKKLFSSYS